VVLRNNTLWSRTAMNVLALILNSCVRIGRCTFCSHLDSSHPPLFCLRNCFASSDRGLIQWIFWRMVWMDLICGIYGTSAASCLQTSSQDAIQTSSDRGPSNPLLLFFFGAGRSTRTPDYWIRAHLESALLQKFHAVHKNPLQP
jgi:hypothetical protein